METPVDAQLNHAKVAEAPLLRAIGVSVQFGGLKAVTDVSVEVQPGRITALIGPNGAGKTTLLNVLSGFQRSDGGQVLFRGRDVSSLPSYTRVSLGMARTFQDVEILPHLTVLENTLLGIQRQWGESVWRLLIMPLGARRQHAANMGRALSILSMLGIERWADELAGNLSYGDQKLLALARLIATDADLLMLDEPGAGLPRNLIHYVGDVLQRLVREHGKTVLLIDHNMNLVMEYADHVVVLHHGRVIASGSPETVKRDPEVVRVYLSR